MVQMTRFAGNISRGWSKVAFRGAANHEHNFDLLAEPCPPMYLERKRLIADFHP
jgi:hypothetical protein